MTPASRDTAKNSKLPERDFSPIWLDHELGNEAATLFSDWLTSQLEQLEARYRPFWSHRSVAKSLNR